MPPHQTGIPFGLANIMHAFRFRKTAHTAQLDVDDASCLQPNRLLGMVRRPDAFVQTNRRIERALQNRVIDDVVVRKRLLNHHQIELVQLLQMIDIVQAYRRSSRPPSA